MGQPERNEIDRESGKPKGREVGRLPPPPLSSLPFLKPKRKEGFNFTPKKFKVATSGILCDLIRVVVRVLELSPLPFTFNRK